MSTETNDSARTAAFNFARTLVPIYQAQLREQLIGAYLLGSLAHGGYSHRYSDIDMALVTENGLDEPTLTALRGLAAEHDVTLGKKLSVFWSDRRFRTGRFPPLDRTDYLDNRIVLSEHERVLPARPTLDEIRAYLKGAPLSNWAESACRFAAMDMLTPDDHKAFIRALLYPARLVYSWTTGRLASNDNAVAFTCENRPLGMDTGLLRTALAYRKAGADPGPLFPERGILPHQVESCIRFVTGPTGSFSAARFSKSR
jgi:predicted nucleotidyltransferase